MAERGRKPGFKLTDEHRGKIQNSNILNALIEHVEGRREMSSTQVTAALGLLKKVMPDLSSTEHSGEIVRSYVMRGPEKCETPEQWQQKYAPTTH